jgi:hypothetical protein
MSIIKEWEVDPIANLPFRDVSLLREQLCFNQVSATPQDIGVQLHLGHDKLGILTVAGKEDVDMGSTGL